MADPEGPEITEEDAAPPPDGRSNRPEESVSSPTPAEEALAEHAAVEAPDEPDWQDLALRKAAEVENLRKQTAQRVQKASRDGMRRVVLELLPALDDFDRALAHAEAEEGDEEHHLTKGIRLVQQKMLGALQRTGIEAFSPDGERFDPHLHEAVASQPADGVESGTVIEVYQAGYRLGDEVLRAAKVVVAA